MQVTLCKRVDPAGRTDGLSSKRRDVAILAATLTDAAMKDDLLKLAAELDQAAEREHGDK